MGRRVGAVWLASAGGTRSQSGLPVLFDWAQVAGDGVPPVPPLGEKNCECTLPITRSFLAAR